MTTAEKPQMVSVIDIGTSAIRMVIAEIGSKGAIRYIENLQKPIRFGRDVFTERRLSQQAMNESIRILSDFKEVMDGYGITKVRAVASSAVREASNRENFIDRVFVRTGIDVEIIEGPEENRLELIAVQHALGDRINLDQKNCLILEVGAGSTEMMMLRQGEVELTRALPFGSMRFPDDRVDAKRDPDAFRKALKQSIREVVTYTAKEMIWSQVDTFVAIGGDMRFAAKQLTEVPPETGFVTIGRKPFLDFVAKLGKQTPEEMASHFGIPYTQAEPLYPALLYYQNFLNETAVQEVVVPTVSIRDGLLLEWAQILSGVKRTEVNKQILHSAKHLAERYQYDKAHAQCVASLALKLFDQLKSDHGMGGAERLLLEVAAILHDIGAFISPAAHHKHSSYLVSASEIFGLRKSDKDIVANVVRYHRRSTPKPTHVEYASLSRQDRAKVTKLAAILRVADALDQGHQQKAKSLELEKTNQAYVIWLPEEVGDIGAERASIEDKGAFFGDVFGLPILVRRKTTSQTP